MHLPCKQADAGALPADSTTFSIGDFGSRISECDDGLIRHAALQSIGKCQFKIFNDRCGELDQSTERSLINSSRWVQLPPPLPISDFRLRISDCKSVTGRAASGRRDPQSAICNPQSAIHREAFRLPACKSGVEKPAGSDDWSVTSASHQFPDP